MAAFLFSVLWPVLLHMILSDASVILLTAATGSTPDAALCTSLAAFLVIPPAMWMYRKDRGIFWKSSGDFFSAKDRGTKHEIQQGRSKIAGLVCFAAGGVLNVIWSQVLFWLRIQEHFSNQTQENLLAAQLIVQVIGLGILVPVAEELIFRGLLYGRLRQAVPVWASVFLASAIFALYHGNVIQILFAFPMAVILTLLYEKGKWLGYPILFHMGANLTTIVLELLLR